MSIHQAGVSMSDPSATQSLPADHGELIIPALEEQVHIGVREVDTGRGVRIRTAVSEKLEQVEALLRQEEIEVVHVPVDRVVTPEQAPVSRYDGDTLVVPILEEVLVVEKRIRIKEEVRITRIERQQRHMETVPLKSEHVVVERFGGGAEGEREADGGDAARRQ
ncbi:MAG: YsnF/AvaK domain-containing protein [Massilia sp.]